jgi:transcriptional regulator with XRE-family HTH domain
MPFAESENAEPGQNPHEIRTALGAVLRRVRESQARSLTDVARAAEISPAHLSEVERGLKELSIERLVDVANSLGMTPARIYEQLSVELSPRMDTSAVARHADPRTQLELASRALPPRALRSLADFTLYLASTHAGAGRRRIGFSVHD